MIDLTKSLPNAIEGEDGKLFLLNTDYRYWIRFYEDLQRNEEELDISYLFKNEAPIITQSITNQLMSFLYNPSITPKGEPEKEKILDYVLDGEYIYSALYATYGIDIVDMEMHWHKFQALCNNITGESTLWGYAKQMRGYRKPKKSDTFEKMNEKAKKAWSFPVEEKVTKEMIQSADDFEEYFSQVEDLSKIER